MKRTLLGIVGLLLVLIVLPPLLGTILGGGPNLDLLPSRGRSAKIADGRLMHLVERGEGTPVVFVHGLPSSVADWGEVPEKLAELGSYRTIAYDRIGYGYSSRQPAVEQAFTVESNAADLEALLNALDIDQAVLVGWSYGGEVIARLAEDRPSRASHLVFIGSPSSMPLEGGGGPLDSLLASPMGPAVLKWVSMVPPLSRRITQDMANQAFAREQSVPVGWVESTMALLSLPGTLDAFATEERLNDPASLHPEKLDQPALVIHGADDYLVPYHVGEDLDRRLPNSKFVTVLQGSHMLPLTHPDLVAEQIHELVGAW